MNIEDAVGLACIGLVTAVDKYDPDTSGAFASYVSLWIMQNISRMQTTQRPFVYYPAHKKEGYFAMYPVLKKYGWIECQELNRCEKARELVMKQLSCDDRTALDIIMQMIADKSLKIKKIACIEINYNFYLYICYQKNTMLRYLRILFYKKMRH